MGGGGPGQAKGGEGGELNMLSPQLHVACKELQSKSNALRRKGSSILYSI